MLNDKHYIHMEKVSKCTTEKQLEDLGYKRSESLVEIATRLGYEDLVVMFKEHFSNYYFWHNKELSTDERVYSSTFKDLDNGNIAYVSDAQMLMNIIEVKNNK